MATPDVFTVKDQPGISLDVEKLQAEIDTSQDSSALFDTDEFRIYCYKVLPCSKRAAHEWTTCPWAHPGEKARRRDPRIYNYLAIPCQETKEGKDCPRGDECPNCHSLFEYWLHPSRYRTQLCRNNDGNHCKRQICFFAHSIEELRVPDHSHLKIPDEIKQASVNKDASKDHQEKTDSPAASGSPKAAPGSPADGSPKSVTTPSAAPQPKKDRRNSKGSISRPAAAWLPGLPPPSAVMAGIASTIGMDVPCSPGGQAVRLAAPAIAGMSNQAMAALLSCPGVLGVQTADGAGAQWAQQQQLAALQNGCTASAALRRASSLDVAAAGPGRLSCEVPAAAAAAGRFSLDAVMSSAQSAALWGSSSLFSSGMAADPEVPDPSNSPQSAARRALLLRQQQMQLLQSQQPGQQLDAATVEQQLQIIMARQQQAALVGTVAASAASSRRGSSVDYAASVGGSRRGSYVDYAAGGGSRRGSFVDYSYAGSRRGSYVDYSANAASRRGSSVEYISGTNSPPMSPETSSMLGSGSSGIAEEYQSVSSYASPYMGVPTTAAWPPPHLHRTISDPPAYGNLPAIPGAAFRYNSADAAMLTASAASQIPVSAADVAAAAAATRAQMELLHCSPETIAAAAAISAGFPAGFAPVAQTVPEPAVAGDQLCLQNVADLVDSVNRGELGNRGNEVLTGVIGLLMQQLQQQQLTV